MRENTAGWRWMSVALFFGKVAPFSVVLDPPANNGSKCIFSSPTFENASCKFFDFLLKHHFFHQCHLVQQLGFFWLFHLIFYRPDVPLVNLQYFRTFASSHLLLFSNSFFSNAAKTPFSSGGSKVFSLPLWLRYSMSARRTCKKWVKINIFFMVLLCPCNDLC